MKNTQNQNNAQNTRIPGKIELSKEKKLRKKKECEGCEVEMITAYDFQEQGYDVGFTWSKGNKHCFVFVLDKKGNIMVW